MNFEHTDDRRMLAELAVNDAAAFSVLVQSARAALPAGTPVGDDKAA